MESWPTTEPELVVDRAEVRAHLERVRGFLRDNAIDAVVITSSDRHLNEYTPATDNHRLFLSGFTGSTAYMLVPSEGRARLFVDGRYYIQADLEVDAADVEVVKVPYGVLLTTALIDQARGFAKVGYEADRVSKSFADSLTSATSAVPLDRDEVGELLPRVHRSPTKPLHYIPSGISGRTPAEKLEAVFKTVRDPERSIILLAALDDIAWLTDARGYHFAYQSSYAARAFATRDGIHVSVAPELLASARTGAPPGVHFHSEPIGEILRRAEYDGIDRFCFDPVQVTPAFIREVIAARSGWRPVSTTNPVVTVRAVKTAPEIEHMEACNERSALAITNTLRWVRSRLARGERVSETAFYEAANRFYAEVGARDLSFHTISAIGANSAIIHFSKPSDAIVASPDDLMLLDSGALYEGGFSTDITRTFLAGGRRGKASNRQKQLYTLVLKGLLQGMMAIFPEGTRGSFLDAVVRAPIYRAGFEYGHGTGHGVGIHVHEPGISISPISALPIRAGQVSSIEPGIYIEGFGGVRLENVVVYEKHPDKPGFLRSRPLNWVGFDENLVDRELLDGTETKALDDYQNECRRRGTADFEASGA